MCPHVAKKVPRQCPRCLTGIVRQKYYKFCGRCHQELKREKKERKELIKELMSALDR